MILLVDGHTHGDRPICVAFVAIAVRGIVAMTVILELACFTIVGDSNGMKTVCPTVGSHCAGLGHLLTLATLHAVAAPPAIGVPILISGLHIPGEEGYSVR